MYSTIVVPIDTTYAQFSGWLRKTLEVAYDLAKKSGASFLSFPGSRNNLLKGYYPDIYSESVANDVKAKLQAIAKEMLPGWFKSAITRSDWRDLLRKILRMAREINASEIVLASHGPVLKDYVVGGYSGDGGQAFHLKADSDSGRSRTAFR